jgi:hypothetical protein
LLIKQTGLVLLHVKGRTKSMVDKKALKLLFKRYWSSSGWTDTHLSKEELDYALATGIMFEQRELSHDDIIQQVNKIVHSLTL